VLSGRLSKYYSVGLDADSQGRDGLVNRTPPLHGTLRCGTLPVAPSQPKMEGRCVIGTIAFEGGRTMLEWRTDVRVAVRSLRRQPLFALAVIGTLALGIGASTAVFGVLRVVLLEPLPYDAPEALILVWARTRDSGERRVRLAGADAARVSAEVGGVSSAAFVLPPVDVLFGEGAGAVHARLGRVTTAFFDVLGVTPSPGRGFEGNEGGLADGGWGRGAVVLSHALWQSRYGGDSGVIGQDVAIDGVPVRVVGVAARDFVLLLPAGSGLSTDVDTWVSVGADASVLGRPAGLRDQDTDDTGVLVARLAPGASIGVTGSALATVSAQLRAEDAGYAEAGFELVVKDMHEDVVSESRPALLAISGAVGFVLLVSCINVANLLLARLSGRSGELSVRAALGAGRLRLMVQTMTESLVAALAGGATGVVLAQGMTRALVAWSPQGLVHGGVPPIDGVTVAFAAVVTIVAGISCGIIPALRAATAGRAMTAGISTRVADGSPSGARRALVIVEIALSLVLLTGAGLLGRSFVSLQSVDAGFDARGLITFGITLPPGTVGGPGARAGFMREVAEVVRRVPGVRAVGLSGALPLSGEVWMQPWGLAHQASHEWERNAADFRVISADYFEAMGTRVLAGRSFTIDEDRNEDGRVVIVDVQLAGMVSTDGNAIGHTIGFPLDGRPVLAEIVGIVEPVRHASLRTAGGPTLYVPYRQEASRSVGFAVRVEGGAGPAMSAIHTAVVSVLAGTPAVFHDERPMQALVDRSTMRERFTLALSIVFAAIALIMAAIGLYGVIAFLVSRRTRELGIRSALGATTGDIVRQVMGDGLRMAGVGIATGTGLAIALAFAIRPLLFNVAPVDPLTLGSVALLLGAVALLACWIPARRACRVDPVVALRGD
jgi:predicted permease